MKSFKDNQQNENENNKEQQDSPKNNDGIADHYQQRQHQQQQSEAAGGIVRGISRSLVTIGRNNMKNASRYLSIGRLPKRATIARVSDRVATGLDVYDHWNETSATTPSSSKSTNPKLLQRIWNVARSFTGNAILGMAVFETYGYIIEKMQQQKQQHLLTNEDITSLQYVDVYQQASISQHFMSGFVGGSAHAVLSSGSLLLTSRPTTTTKLPTISQTLKHTLQLFPRQALHHGIAHGCLFSTFEWVKRSLLSSRYYNDYYYVGDDDDDDGDNKKSLQDDSHQWEFAVAVTIAGGLSGQVQHVLSHYTEPFLETPSSISWKNLPPPPSIRSILVAFPASAIGFIAFEYGKNISGMIDDE